MWKLPSNYRPPAGTPAGRPSARSRSWRCRVTTTTRCRRIVRRPSRPYCMAGRARRATTVSRRSSPPSWRPSPPAPDLLRLWPHPAAPLLRSRRATSAPIPRSVMKTTLPLQRCHAENVPPRRLQVHPSRGIDRRRHPTSALPASWPPYSTASVTQPSSAAIALGVSRSFSGSGAPGATASTAAGPAGSAVVRQRQPGGRPSSTRWPRTDRLGSVREQTQPNRRWLNVSAASADTPK